MRRSFPTLLALAVALALPGLTRAGFIVSDTSDNAADPNSLRYAIDNLSSGDNSITFAANLAGQTITLTNGELRINDNVTITGPSGGTVTLSGDNASHVFEFAPTVTAMLSNLTITGGSDVSGGGIINHGNLTVNDSTITGNNAGVGGGGGFYNTGELTITDSTISDNTGTYGGGIVNSGTVTITDSILSGNSASYGGGIYNGSGGKVTLNYTTVENSLSGGDLYQDTGNGSTYSGMCDTIDDGSYLSSFTDSGTGPVCVPEPSSLMLVVSAAIPLVAFGVRCKWHCLSTTAAMKVG